VVGQGCRRVPCARVNVYGLHCYEVVGYVRKVGYYAYAYKTVAGYGVTV